MNTSLLKLTDKDCVWRGERWFFSNKTSLILYVSAEFEPLVDPNNICRLTNNVKVTVCWDIMRQIGNNFTVEKCNLTKEEIKDWVKENL